MVRDLGEPAVGGGRSRRTSRVDGCLFGGQRKAADELRTWDAMVLLSRPMLGDGLMVLLSRTMCREIA